MLERDLHIGSLAPPMFSSFSPPCAFCHHVNPPDARFCNACGSPLHLKPCRQCEAINDQAAKRCYKCGTEDPALVTIPDAAPISLAANSVSTALTPSDAGVVREHPAAGSSSAGQRVEMPLRWQEAATASDAPSGVEIVAHETVPSDEDVPSEASQAPASTPAIQWDNGATTGRRAPGRIAQAGIVSAVLLIAVATFAYHAYRNPLQVWEWFDATRASSDKEPRSIPAQSPAPPATLSASNVTATTAQGAVPANTLPADVPPALGTQEGSSTAASDSVASKPLAPNESLAAAPPQPASPTSTQTNLGQPAAASAIPKTTPKKSKKPAKKKAASTQATSEPKATLTLTNNAKTTPRE